MRLLFTSGLGILPEQRIHRWKMVSELYRALGEAFRKLGHQTFYCLHPEVMVDGIPSSQIWTDGTHQHFVSVLQRFRPDFVFCWNGSSAGDVTTSTLAAAHGAKGVYSEQGWFPQKTTLYFDLSGCNAKCGTRNRGYPALSSKERARMLQERAAYIENAGIGHLFDAARFEMRAPELTKPIFVPLQDERDLNIVQDSEFKTMNEFVGYLARTYPAQRFLVRPHPKYQTVNLEARANVEVDDPRRPLFEGLARCGMVVGLNSTVLLESALLGYPVVSFAESLATGTGLFRDVRVSREARPFAIDTARVDTPAAEAVLWHLLQKQMLRSELSNPVALMQSQLFRELRRNLEWRERYC